jgi:hypothetical protein
MELVRLVAPLARRDALIELSKESMTLFRCSDADTVIAISSLRDQLTGEVGVWLKVGTDYPAQLCARDVKTLSLLVDLRHVVIEAHSQSALHADIVRALLTNDEVNFENELATIEGAYNRPAPPAPLTVWSYEDETLTSERVALYVVRVEPFEGLDVAVFA